MDLNKLFISRNIIVENKFLNGGILVSEIGKILKVLRQAEVEAFRKSHNVEIVDVGNNVIMPGIIDSHVHVNEPGRTDWEGFETATKAAAAGGVTTIVDMPLNSIPPTTTVENLKQKLIAANGKTYVDVAFWGGVIPGNQDDLVDMVKAGVVGFKCFMCESGVQEFPSVNKDEIETAMKILQNTDSVLAFHAELEDKISEAIHDDPTHYDTFLQTRPASMEINAIKLVIEMAKKYNVRVHIVHLSTAEALSLIAEAKKNGVNISVETCHHYLNLKHEDIPDKATQFKCTPPIRDLKNLNLLWDALKDGTIDMIVSDHSPCVAELKRLEDGDFLKAWGGISSLQFGLSLFWTQAKNRGLSIFDINTYMTVAPAKLVGLHNVKGRIATHYDADFVIWDPHSIIHIDPKMIHHKNKITPYLGKNLYGRILKTVVRGHIVYDNETFIQKPIGNLIHNLSV